MGFQWLRGSKQIESATNLAVTASRAVSRSDRAPVQLFPLKRRLTVVLLADVVGYSRLMSRDEEGTHRRIGTYVKGVIEPALTEHGGQLVRSMGDGMLVEFRSALDAVRCGLDIQQRLAERQRDIKDDKILLRIGINTGDVITDSRDIYGHSVNITARLEAVARAGSVCVSQSIHDQTRSEPGLRFTDKGLHRAKNIDYPIRVFEVEYGQAAPAARWHRRLPRTYMGLAAAGLAGIVILGGLAAVNRGGNGRENSIIVLPFRNLSSSADDEYFADAITDDLTTDLSRLPRSFVIATATAMTYKGKSADARQIGQECGVRYLLEGSIRRTGQTAQINVQLVDTATGASVWADRFVHESTSLPELEEAVTGRIGASLHVAFAKDRKHDTAGTFAADHNPLDERMRAMALLAGPHTPEKWKEAHEAAENCVKQDPGSAECWALLAQLSIGSYLNGWNNVGPEGIDRAEIASRRALEIDPSNAMAHFAAGNVRRARGDFLGALSELEKAIELDPNHALAHAQKAQQFLFLGRGSEAVAAVNKAINLSPADPSIGFFYWVLGRAYFFEGKYAEAADWLAKAVKVRPNIWYSRAWLISALTLTGQHPEADAVLGEFTQKFPAYSLKKITTYYAEEPMFKSAAVQAASEHLIRGLTLAGLQ